MENSANPGQWSDDRVDNRERDEFEDEELVNSPNGGMFQSRPTSQAENLNDFLAPAPLSEAETIGLGKESIRTFLSSRTVYDAMPKSGRVVVFDVNINLKLVLYALLEHEIRGAPLWNPSVQRLVGMVTLSDFGDLIRHSFYASESAVDILEQHTITTWRSLIRGASGTTDEVGKKTALSLAKEWNAHKDQQKITALISVPPSSTLFNACSTLRQQCVHRLPVVDPDNQTCLQVITFQSILEYLMNQFREERRLFDQKIYDLGVGTFAEPKTSQFMGRPPAPAKDLFTATTESKLAEVFDIFAKNRISTIPIIDAQTNKVRDIYRRSFLANLKLDEADLTSKPMIEILRQYETSSVDGLERVHTCTPNQTLYNVFLLLAETKARTLIIVDDKGSLCGICSLSDVLCHFL